MKRYHIIFSGVVQGVGFRFTARGLADRYRLNGWVRNTADGGVETEVEGNAASINNFVDALCREFSVNISGYKKKELLPYGRYEGFNIKF